MDNKEKMNEFAKEKLMEAVLKEAGDNEDAFIKFLKKEKEDTDKRLKEEFVGIEHNE